MAEALERPFFELLVPDAETRPVPKKNLAFVTTFVEVDKQMTTKGILAHHVMGEHREFIKSTTHVRRLSVEEDAHRRGQR